jgi:alpha-N-arabinofuranosidase
LSLEPASVRLGTQPIGEVSPHLFGALTEHFGRAMYGGLWDQGRDVARADVRASVEAFGYTMLRYPGGCFSDWYHWRDGTGPKESRPTHPEQFWTGFRFDPLVPPAIASAFELPEATRLAFGPPETNAVGTDEFLQYCVDTSIEPMLVANFGTGDAAEAADWVRYTNRSPSSPRPVRWWGVGNETYGVWELGHCSPEQYGRRFGEYARAMRAVDPGVKLVAVGCAGGSGSYPETWNATVVEEAADDIDALSLHWYFPGTWVGRRLRDDEADYLQLAAGSDDLGETLDAAMRQVDAVTGPERKLALSLDEWNLWVELEDLLETNARLADAAFFAGCYNRMLERADRVQIAMISHLVNCMAPIQTRGDRHFVTSSYLIGALYSKFARGSSLPVEIDCERFSVPDFAGTAVPELETAQILANSGTSSGRSARVIDAAATRDDRGTSVFLTNRRLDRAVRVAVGELAPRGNGRFRYLSGPGPFAANDVDRPDTLHFREVAAATDARGVCTFDLPPCTSGVLIVADR